MLSSWADEVLTKQVSKLKSFFFGCPTTSYEGVFVLFKLHWAPAVLLHMCCLLTECLDSAISDNNKDSLLVLLVSAEHLHL